jgi:hypothetical protein
MLPTDNASAPEVPDVTAAAQPRQFTYRLSYRYENAGPAGPNRGQMEITTAVKPRRGDRVSAVFGSAVVSAVSRRQCDPQSSAA